jgi:hypothetical protein
VAGSSLTFACCLRLITSPIRPEITSNVPAIMSQCGSCSHSMAVLTMSTYLFAFSPSSTKAPGAPSIVGRKGRYRSAPERQIGNSAQ